MGTGTGAGVDVDPRDKRRTEYIRRARSKIGRFWSFPKWAALEGMQGTAIVTFTIHANGTVSGVSVTRPSGIPEYDEICRKAVLSAAPFEPLPSELGSTFRWSMPFEARNPAVRPKSVSGAAER
jgi:TonB family protein